jgi:ABC-type sugar transport system ATPase subunit
VALCASEDGLPAEVALVERLGGEALAHFRVGGEGHALVAKLSGDTALTARDNVRLQIDTAHCHFFDSQGNAMRLPA